VCHPRHRCRAKRGRHIQVGHLLEPGRVGRIRCRDAVKASFGRVGQDGAGGQLAGFPFFQCQAGLRPVSQSPRECQPRRSHISGVKYPSTDRAELSETSCSRIVRQTERRSSSCGLCQQCYSSLSVLFNSLTTRQLIPLQFSLIQIDPGQLSVPIRSALAYPLPGSGHC